MSHLLRAQSVCLKAQNSTIVATVKCLGHISRWGARKERIFISQSSLSLSALLLCLQTTVGCNYIPSPQCLHVCSSARALSPLSFSLFANHNRLQPATVKSLGHISRWGAWKEHVCSSARALSLSPLSFSPFANHSGLQLYIYLSRSPQCLHQNLSGPCSTAVSAYMYALWPHEAHTDVYILYIILGLIFKLLLSTAVHIWFPTSFYFSTQTTNIPWHLNILIYVHHDHSKTLTKAQSFKWKKKMC